MRGQPFDSLPVVGSCLLQLLLSFIARGELLTYPLGTRQPFAHLALLTLIGPESPLDSGLFRIQGDMLGEMGSDQCGIETLGTRMLFYLRCSDIRLRICQLEQAPGT